jgi:hypothetical protein
MSGGGGGGGGTADWRPTGNVGGGNDPCNVVETTALNSPVRAVVSTLNTGDVLDIVFVPGPPQQLLAQHNGRLAGSITSPSMLQIINCINQGHSYIARVLSVRGAICEVRIQRR